MQPIKISVIIPVYNVEKYLRQCVDSVLNQTYKNIEVILVDDGSPDSSPMICDEYAKNDGRVKVVHKQNGGASSARNAGLDVFTGDYVVFVDSDDFWNSNDFLREAVNSSLSIKSPDVLIFGFAEYYTVTEAQKNYIDFSNKFVGDNKTEQVKSLVVNNMFQSSAWNKIVSAKLFKDFDMKFIEGIYSEDIDWNARLLINCDSFDVYDKTIYMYRQNETSVTHTKRKKYISDLKNNIITITELSKKIKDEPYYEYYMNYCAYQYITFLNCICTIDKSENISDEKAEMKKYRWLLNYHINPKVKKVYTFNKIFGFELMLKILKIFLKLRG